MRIGTREIGSGHPVYIIAELGVNHDGSVERALEMVDAAADAGADAIKMQLFRADMLMSGASRLADYQAAAGETDPREMLRRLELPMSAMGRIADRAHARGMGAIVTVFSVELVSEAELVPWDAYKTASPDIIHRPLLERLALTNKPLIVSTGASTGEEIVRADGWLGASRRGGIAYLQCVSSYPTRDADASLGGIGAIAELELIHHGIVGYSDHTARTDTGRFAVDQDACILEKHLTYDRAAAGPDHEASLDPAQFREYCTLARTTHQGHQAPSEMIGLRAKRVLPCEQDVRSLSRQSIVAARDIAPGARITRDMLTFKRPGTGLPPFALDEVISAIATRRIYTDTPLVWEDLTR